jgi:hypothetical protein
MKIFALLLTIALLFTSCYTKKRALEKFCKPTSVTIVLDTIINTITPIAGDSGQVNLDCEKFKALYDSLLSSKSYKVDSNGYKTIFENKKTKLKAKPNKNGSIDFNVVDKGDTAKASTPIQITKTAPCNCPEAPAPTFWQKAQPYIIGLCIGAMVAMLLVLSFGRPRL